MSDALRSALYPGRVWHKRFKPREHGLRYDILMMLFDLAELDRMHRTVRGFSRGRFNLLSFYDADHGDGSETPLYEQIQAHLKRANIVGGGAITVLAMPRVFGLVFNPLTLYFCHGVDEALVAILYEVNNTFGQRHSYLTPVVAQGGDVRQTCAKRFYVSPFMDMDLTYRFKVRPVQTGAEGETLAVEIEVDDAQGLMLTARFTGRRQAVTSASVIKAALAQPLLMFKVVGAIHWEALKIWLKGIRLRTRPPAPAEPVTISR